MLPIRQSRYGNVLQKRKRKIIAQYKYVSRETLRKENTMKYRARFYIMDENGNRWAESSTPLWDDYKVAQDNAEQYAEYVNMKTRRTVVDWTIVTV